MTALLAILLALVTADLQADADARKTVVIQGRHERTEPLVLDRDGSRVVFDGGQQCCLHFDDEAIVGNAPALMGRCLLLEIRGAGAVVDGGANFIGYRQAAAPWKEIPHDKLPKLAILIRGAGGEKGTSFALDNGSATFGPLFIGGFQRGIQFGEGLDENNADNCHFGYVTCSHCDNLICFKNRQSVSNTFVHVRQFADGSQEEQRAFELLRFEAGGKCVVDHAEINQGLVCRAIRSDWNTGFCRIDTLSTDPAGGKAFKLFDGAPDPSVANIGPCPFILTIGELWNGIDWRESSETAGYMVDAYAGQRVNVNGGGLIEAKNGPSVRLRGSDKQRAVMVFTGVTFDTKATPAALLSDDSEHCLLRWVDCFDRAGKIIQNGSVPRD